MKTTKTTLEPSDSQMVTTNNDITALKKVVDRILPTGQRNREIEEQKSEAEERQRSAD